MRKLLFIIVIVALQGCSVFLSEDNDDAVGDTGTETDTGGDADTGTPDAPPDVPGDSGETCTEECVVPAASCNGNATVTYANPRQTDDCGCTYDVETEDCGDDICVDGVCADPCADTVCTPPSPVCSDGVFTRFTSECAVVDGDAECQVTGDSEVCGDGQVCIAGDSGGCPTACDTNNDCGAGFSCDTQANPSHCIPTGELCDGVLCPMEACSDDSTFVRYAAAGTCNDADGACVYGGEPEVTLACPAGICTDGVCLTTCGDETCAPDVTACEGSEEEGDLRCGDEPACTDDVCPDADSRVACDVSTQRCRYTCTVVENCPTAEGWTASCDGAYCDYRNDN